MSIFKNRDSSFFYSKVKNIYLVWCKYRRLWIEVSMLFISDFWANKKNITGCFPYVSFSQRKCNIGVYALYVQYVCTVHIILKYQKKWQNIPYWSILSCFGGVCTVHLLDTVYNTSSDGGAGAVFWATAPAPAHSFELKINANWNRMKTKKNFEKILCCRCGAGAVCFYNR